MGAQAAAPPAESIRSALRAICRSAAFQSAPQLQKLLRYLVEQSLEGNPLKESIVGVAVFGRDPGYDPKKDGIVRTEARRLRSKLVEHYAAEAAGETVLIDLPKGSYVPVFRCLEPPAPVLVPSVPVRKLAPRWWLALLSAAVLISALLAVAIRNPWRTPRTPSPAPDRVQRPSVAVLDFRNLAARPEAAWLSGAIPEMISADLAVGRDVRTIPGENVSRMETELSLHPASAFSHDTLAAIRQDLGADIVVSGAYADLGPGSGGRIRVDIWAADAQTGETITSVSETGAEPEILDLVSRAGSRLRSGLHLETAEAASEPRAADLSPRNPTAARAYAAGLADLRRADFPQARRQFQLAIQIEPGFAPSHAAYSSAAAKLGYEGLARSEAQRAYELSASLANSEQKLAIEAQYREANNQPAQAAEVCARLFSAHPDNIEYGLRLARAQADEGHPPEALRTIDALRRLPAPESDDPRIDMEAAYAYAAQGDYRASAPFAGRAAVSAQRVHANLLYAHAISLQSGLFWYLGDARGRGLSEEARRICEQFQDKACVAAILRRLGNSSLGSIDLTAADGYYSEALTLAREIGSAGEESQILNGMALVAVARGDLRRAASMQRQLIALGEQTQSLGTEQRSLANLSDVLFYQGDLEGARDKAKAALKIARAVESSAETADDLTSLATIDQAAGDLAQSRRDLQEAETNAQQAGSVPSQLAVLAQKGRLLMAEDNLPAARKALQQAETLGKTGVNVAAWADPLLAANLALALRQPAAAAALAAEVVKAGDARHVTWQATRAQSLLAQAFLMQGNGNAARAAAQEAWARAEPIQWRLVRLEVAITYARANRAAGSFPALVAEAHSLHAYELELEARLAALELSPDPRQSAAFQAEARAHGFLYLARCAAEIR